MALFCRIFRATPQTALDFPWLYIAICIYVLDERNTAKAQLSFPDSALGSNRTTTGHTRGGDALHGLRFFEFVLEELVPWAAETASRYARG